MKVKTISVVYERKINLGNYHSVHLGITLWADLDEGDDEIEATTTLQTAARQHVKSEWVRLKAADPAISNN